MKRARFPFGTLVTLGALSFVLVDYPPLRIRYVHTPEMVRSAEFYPLSSFSMYSTFSDQPFTVYVTHHDEPVAIEHTLKSHASELKKTYEAKLKALRAKRGGRILDLPAADREEAGRETLRLLCERQETRRWLAEQPDPLLKLHQVVLTTGEGGVQRTDTVVAEYRPPNLSSAP